jgi:hypothetical protein
LKPPLLQHSPSKIKLFNDLLTELELAPRSPRQVRTLPPSKVMEGTRAAQARRVFKDRVGDTSKPMALTSDFHADPILPARPEPDNARRECEMQRLGAPSYSTDDAPPSRRPLRARHEPVLFMVVIPTHIVVCLFFATPDSTISAFLGVAILGKKDKSCTRSIGNLTLFYREDFQRATHNPKLWHHKQYTHAL